MSISGSTGQWFNRDNDMARWTARTAEDIAKGKGAGFATISLAEAQAMCLQVEALGHPAQVDDLWAGPGVTHWFTVRTRRQVLENLAATEGGISNPKRLSDAELESLRVKIINDLIGVDNA